MCVCVAFLRSLVWRSIRKSPFVRMALLINDESFAVFPYRSLLRSAFFSASHLISGLIGIQCSHSIYVTDTVSVYNDENIQCAYFLLKQVLKVLSHSFGFFWGTRILKSIIRTLLNIIPWYWSIDQYTFSLLNSSIQITIFIGIYIGLFPQKWQSSFIII